MFLTRRNKATNKSVEMALKNRSQRVDARNKVLIARYYYWTEIRRRRFDDVMRILAESEFFIEERTITNAIVMYSDYLNELIESSNARRELAKEYPSWSWN